MPAFALVLAGLASGDLERESGCRDPSLKYDSSGEPDGDDGMAVDERLEKLRCRELLFLSGNNDPRGWPLRG